MQAALCLAFESLLILLAYMSLHAFIRCRQAGLDRSIQSVLAPVHQVSIILHVHACCVLT